MRPWYVFGAVLLLSVLLASCASDTNITASAVAQCLTDNGVAMYGADTCPACQQQKIVFGDSFSQVDYVECDKSTACQENEVRSIPTWINAEGDRIVGVRGLGELAEFGGCTHVLEQVN